MKKLINWIRGLFKKKKIFTGAQCRLLIDGKEIGRFETVGIDYKLDHNRLEEIATLGRYEVAELVPNNDPVVFSCSRTTFVGKLEHKG